MVTKQSLFMLVSIAATGMASCGFGTGPSVHDSIPGTWTWIESTGGIAGVTLTPSSTGDSMTLRFTSEGDVELTRNGGSVRTVGFVTSPVPGEAALQIRYDEPLMGFESQMASFPSAQELVLTDPCCDGFVSRWLRVE